MGYAALTHPTKVLYLIAPSYLAGEESGGVLRCKASDQTEVSTITLIFADVGVCSHSLRHNR
jgi:hypothetical protein